MLEKKPFEGSRVWVGVSFGEDGNGGSDVRSGEFDGSSSERGSKGCGFSALLVCKCPGDPLSVGDVIVLLAGDDLIGIASDREAGLVIFIMSYVKLIKTLI